MKKILSFICLTSVTVFLSYSISFAGSASGGGISDNPGQSESPSLAMNTSGNPIVTWYDHSSSSFEIYIRQWNGSIWEELGEDSASGGGISDNPGASSSPSIAIDASGNPIVVWSDNYANYQTYLKEWNGSTWEELGGSASGGGISDNPVSSYSPSIAIDNSGNPIVAWANYAYSDDKINIYVKRWNGSTWEELGGSASGRGISISTAPSRNPAIAINNSGNPIVVWEDENPPYHTVYIRQWNGSTWEELGGSASGGGISDTPLTGYVRPSIAISNSGNPIVVWRNALPSGCDIYLKEWNGSTWEEFSPGSASGGGISDYSANATYPSIAIDASGNPIVAWGNFDFPDNINIYIKRWNGSTWEEVGAASASGGGISNNTERSEYPSVAVNESGTPVVAWEDNFEIYIKQFNGTDWVEFTPVNPVNNLSATALANCKIKLDWGKSTSDNVAKYNIYYSSGAGDISYASPGDFVLHPQETWTSPIMTDGVTYKFVVRAVSIEGFEEKNANVVTATAVNALSSIPSAIISIPQNGKKISGNRLTVMAQIVDGDDIANVEEVRFQYKVSTDTVWADITASPLGNTVNPDTVSPYFIHWDVLGMEEATYNIRAVAYDLSSNPDPNPASITVIVDHVNPDIFENVSAGSAMRIESIDNGKDNIVRMGGDGENNITEVIIPQGALDTAGAVSLSITDNPADIPDIPSNRVKIGKVKDIKLGSGVNLTGIATIKLPYEDDLAVDENNLMAYTSPDSNSDWVSIDDANFTVYPSSNIVVITTDHFSLYTIMAESTGELNVFTYPNPFGEGGTSFIYTLSEESNVTIKIYTVSGRLIRNLFDGTRTADYHDEDFWDGKDEGTNQLANGVYLYKLTATPTGTGDSISKTGKIVLMK